MQHLRNANDGETAGGNRGSEPLLPKRMIGLFDQVQHSLISPPASGLTIPIKPSHDGIAWGI